MSNKVTDFPQYRKLSNHKVYYCILSDREFEEIRIVGSKAMRFTIKAEQYPEILRIQDMVQMNENAFLLSNEEEYQRLVDNYSLR